MEESGQLHAPTSLPPVSNGKEAVWAPEPSLDAVEKGKFHCPCREPKPGHPACSLVPVLTELPRLNISYVEILFSAKIITIFFLRL
jgi:hypothetical protein